MMTMEKLIEYGADTKDGLARCLGMEEFYLKLVNTMLGDENRGYNAGYSFLGRMFALGQVQGILATVDRELGIEYKQPGFYE